MQIKTFPSDAYSEPVLLNVAISDDVHYPKLDLYASLLL